MHYPRLRWLRGAIINIYRYQATWLVDIDTLRATCADLLGNGWQTRLARALDVDGSTVRRWLVNGVEAPDPVAAFLEALGERQETRGALLFERTATFGEPIAFRTPPPTTIDHMTRRLAFPGVDQLKPMPAIHSAYDGEGDRVVRLNGAPADAIVDRTSRYRMVRHPDARHLKGYADAAARANTTLAVAAHRFHHYTLAMHRVHGSPGIVDYHIVTHGGEIHRVVVSTDDPTGIVTQSLSTIMNI